MINSVALIVPERLIGGVSLFKSPSSSDIITLINEFNEKLSDILRTREYLLSSNGQRDIRYITASPSKPSNIQIQSAESITNGLSADYWDKALSLTDVLMHMPNEARVRWQKDIESWNTPLFEKDAVFDTIISLLLSRDKFLAEQVDGVFKNLSGEHVTNLCSGFYKRMILSDVVDNFGSTNCIKSGYIEDIRVIISKLMGRNNKQELKMHTSNILESAYKIKPGKWFSIDGGALALKVFKKGTVHVQITPDLCWRLNEILSIIHPFAIPEEFKSRQRNSRTEKDFCLHQKLLSVNVINSILSLERSVKFERSRSGRPFRNGYLENTVSAKPFITNRDDFIELNIVLQACGGTLTGGDCNSWVFDYDFMSIKNTIVEMGTIPDHISHQYFPTTRALSKIVAEKLEAKSGESVLEPSGGQGGLLHYIIGSGADITAVEVNGLNCAILKQMNIQSVVHADFLSWSKSAQKYDKIAMNPPFSLNRAKLHLDAAISLLGGSGSKLVAIVPPTLKGSIIIDNATIHWSEPYLNQFDGTCVSVCILEITKI